MSPDEYIRSVLWKYALTTTHITRVRQIAGVFSEIISKWAGQYINELKFSGSFAKGTAIAGSTDVDLFVSLSSDFTWTLEAIYNNLLGYLRNYSPRPQNVSIGIKYEGISIDIIPAKKHPGNTNDHSLYRRKAKTWTQTNVDAHINLVRDSGRQNEIRTAKIWRNLNNLDFPSFYLELVVLEALYRRGKDQLADNFLSVLKYIGDEFCDARLEDPANSSNIISDDLTDAEKAVIARAAKDSLSKKTWEEIIR